MLRRFWLLVLGLIIAVIPVSAQNTPTLAFINNSGQLVVSSGDGNNRWIVTNPGQSLSNSLGFAWAQDGTLLFALNNNSLFQGTVANMGLNPVDTLPEYIAPLQGFANRPNLPLPQGTSPDGNYAFVWSNGAYFLVDLRSNNNTQLIGSNEQTARISGLWADSTPLVAYWGFDGNSILSVTHAPSQNTISLSSNSQIPVTPLAWLPNSTRLLYRDQNGMGRLADVSCVSNGCGSNPLESGVNVLPASASSVQVDNNRAYFVDGETVKGVDLNCVNANNCLDSAFNIGTKVVPLSMMHVSGGRLAFTTYTNAANNPTDRTIQIVNTNCLPGCQPQTVLTSAVAGLLSPDGAYLMVDIADNGLNIVGLASGNVVYLSGSMGGQLGAGLVFARWLI